MSTKQWAAEAEVYYSTARTKRRTEWCVFGTRDEAKTWLNELMQKWRVNPSVVTYVARICLWVDGQWLPVKVRHSVRLSGLPSGGGGD